MTMRIATIIVAMLMVASPNAYSANRSVSNTKNGSLAVELSNSQGDLVVAIRNNSHEPVKINSLLSIDRLFGSIHFIFSNKRNVFDRVIPQINPVSVVEKSYFDLYPRHFYGSQFSLRNLRFMYGLNKACYTVIAYYTDPSAVEFSAFKGRADSRQLKVCMP